MNDGSQAARRTARQPGEAPAAADPVQRGQRVAHHVGGPGRGHAGVAELQLVLEVVPAVALHHVEQQQRAADRPRLGAGVPGAGDDQVGRGHQLRDPLGEAEHVQPRAGGAAAARSRLSRRWRCAPRPRAPERPPRPAAAAASASGPEAPGARHQQHAAVVARAARGSARACARVRRVVEAPAAPASASPATRAPGLEAAHRGRLGRRGGDQVRSTMRVHPEPVRGDIAAEHHVAHGRVPVGELADRGGGRWRTRRWPGRPGGHRGSSRSRGTSCRRAAASASSARPAARCAARRSGTRRTGRAARAWPGTPPRPPSRRAGRAGAWRPASRSPARARPATAAQAWASTS